MVENETIEGFQGIGPTDFVYLSHKKLAVFWSEIKEKISDKVIGIAGCGGLGSNAAMALARVGIKHFVLVDFDLIDETNLNRQYFFRHQLGKKKVHELAVNMLAVNPDIQIHCHDTRLEPGSVQQIFNQCHLIIEAFDTAEAKQMLAESVITLWPGKPLIMGIGMAGVGSNGLIKQVQWDNQVYVCGDMITEIAENEPPLAPRVAVVANMQANLALELLLKQDFE
ncbi:MAG: sulfur carrier protein ThiS adenylyltransferase ThiF [Bacteroidales bacterium]|nr:sulfur carrier protein ThiS adenylyltransferase ThiF [Bacteroidales bacterium]